MLQCRRMRGLIAASIYENLLEEDQNVLAAHLEACPGCRSQAQKLRQLAGAIPVGRPVFEGDLLPVLRFELHHDRVWDGRQWGWKLGFLGGLSVVLVGLFSYQVATYMGAFSRPAAAAIVSASVEGPCLHAELEKASLLVHKHDYVDAYKTLGRAIRDYPDDSLLGLAHLELADLAYTHLKWYPEAYDAYEKVVRLDPKLYTENSAVIVRRNLLAEARENDFASLHALDAAQRSTGQFAELEKVVAKYPGGLVAALAAEDMAGIAAKDLPASERNHVQAMECARDRCCDAIALARLNIELGNLYLKELNNPAKAKDVYEAATQCPDSGLAQLAANSLAGIESN